MMVIQDAVDTFSAMWNDESIQLLRRRTQVPKLDKGFQYSIVFLGAYVHVLFHCSGLNIPW